MSTPFSRALALHKSGHLPEAEALYREVLTQNPRHADASHLLGLLASEAGRHDVAATLIVRAIQFAGPQAVYCSNLGVALTRQGKLAEAAACYRQALALDPSDAATHARLGRTLLTLGLPDQAQQSLEASLALAPDIPETTFDLANVLHIRALYDQAADYYEKTTTLAPEHAEAWYNLGVTRTIQKRLDDAIACYRQALELRPDYTDAHNNLGTLLQAARQPNDAVQHFQQSNSIEARYNLGLWLQQQDRLEEAELEYRTVLDRNPSHAEAHNNLGNVALALNRPDEALKAYETAISLSPTHPEANWNLGLVQLSQGNFEEGWKNYEWRFRQPGSTPRHFPDVAHALVRAASPLMATPAPSRDSNGAPLCTPTYTSGEPRPVRAGIPDTTHKPTILLHAEQGLGDALQFIRFAPQLAALGYKVIVECHPPLIPLFQSNFPNIEFLPFHSPADFDLHAPLLSLPHILGTRLDTIPPAPYLTPDPALTRHWAEILKPYPGPKVGLTWSGNPNHKENAKRSIPPDQLAQLATPGVHFFALQKGQSQLPPELNAHWPETESTTLADTAAILQNLDLLISVDTSVAHLAGALGRPVWTLLPFAPDWRWLRTRPDSPWYPTMRLFRQPSRNDWPPVLTQVLQALKQL